MRGSQNLKPKTPSEYSHHQHDYIDPLVRCWAWIVRLLVAIRALIVRVIFIIYALFAVWTIVIIESDNYFWLLLLTIIPLILEFIVELFFLMRKKHRKGTRWISPVILLFLICACPPIWLGEISAATRINNAIRSASTAASQLDSLTQPPAAIIYSGTSVSPSNSVTTKEDRDVISKVNDHIMRMAPEDRMRVLEQMLLLALIFGRWLLPRGGITRDQLSQLLLVNIGMAADILELFEAFKEVEVRNNSTLTYIILSLWQASLLQFSLIKTATKARKPRGGYIPPNYLLSGDIEGDPNREVSTCLCCETEIWAIGTSLVLQDIPFLVLRLTLILNFHVLSYSNVFFTCKNTLVISLQIFRIVVIFLEHRYPPPKKSQSGRLSMGRNSYHDLHDLSNPTSPDIFSPLSSSQGNSRQLNNPRWNRPPTLPHSQSAYAPPPMNSRRGSSALKVTSSASSPHLDSIDNDDNVQGPPTSSGKKSMNQVKNARASKAPQQLKNSRPITPTALNKSSNQQLQYSVEDTV